MNGMVPSQNGMAPPMNTMVSPLNGMGPPPTSMAPPPSNMVPPPQPPPPPSSMAPPSNPHSMMNRMKWKSQSITDLLNVMQKYTTIDKSRNKSIIFEHIYMEMREKGYTCTKAQLKNKWKKLKERYIAVAEGKSRSLSPHRIRFWPYFDQVQKIYAAFPRHSAAEHEAVHQYSHWKVPPVAGAPGNPAAEHQNPTQRSGEMESHPQQHGHEEIDSILDLIDIEPGSYHSYMSMKDLDRANWSEKATRDLLNCLQTFPGRDDTSKTARKNMSLASIHIQMKRKGYTFSKKQLANKWKKLKASYANFNDPCVSLKKRTSWPFFDQMHAILYPNSKDGSQTATVQNDPLPESSTETTPEPGPSQPPRLAAQKIHRRYAAPRGFREIDRWDKMLHIVMEESKKTRAFIVEENRRLLRSITEENQKLISAILQSKQQ